MIVLATTALLITTVILVAVSLLVNLETANAPAAQRIF
jgi:hypothetical protein